MTDKPEPLDHTPVAKTLAAERSRMLADHLCGEVVKLEEEDALRVAAAAIEWGGDSEALLHELLDPGVVVRLVASSLRHHGAKTVLAALDNGQIAALLAAGREETEVRQAAAATRKLRQERALARGTPEERQRAREAKLGGQP